MQSYPTSHLDARLCRILIDGIILTVVVVSLYLAGLDLRLQQLYCMRVKRGANSMRGHGTLQVSKTCLTPRESRHISLVFDLRLHNLLHEGMRRQRELTKSCLAPRNSAG
jgi:hypothetical protein